MNKEKCGNVLMAFATLFVYIDGAIDWGTLYFLLELLRKKY